MGLEWNPKTCDGDICADTDEPGNLNAQILLHFPEYPATPFTWNKKLSGTAPKKFNFPQDPPSFPSLLPDPQGELKSKPSSVCKI